MMIDSATERSLETIARRAADVQKAFSPGAVPRYADTATPSPSSRFVFDPLSVSAPAGDYFIVSTERGRRYTRDGSFSIRNGVLCSERGRPVLGAGVNGGTLRELRVDPVDAALGRVSNARLESDGTVRYDRIVVDPRTGARERQSVSLGRLALARFPAATKLAPDEHGDVAAPQGIAAHIGEPGDGNFGGVQPMRREESRVDIDRGLEHLHDAYVAFDALLAAHKAQGHTGKVAMDLLK